MYVLISNNQVLSKSKNLKELVELVNTNFRESLNYSTAQAAVLKHGLYNHQVEILPKVFKTLCSTSITFTLQKI